MRRGAAHLVVEARLREDEAWVRCSCGALIVVDDAEDANHAFQRHRVDGGDRRGEGGVRYDGTGPTWRKTVTVKPERERSAKTSADYNRAYAARHPERVREQKRAYRERKRAERAA